MSKPTVYLDKGRQTEAIRYIQRVKRVSREGVVVLKNATLADRLNCSESTARRTIKELVDAGHLIKVQVPKPGGGFLNAYDVDTNIIYRTSSFLRRVRKQVEHASTMRKANGDAGSGCRCGGGSKGFKSKNNNKYKRKRNRSVDNGDWQALMSVARAAGVDDSQRGYLGIAARRYGVKEAWEALVIAFERGYRVRDLVRVTWGILKRWHNKEAIAT